MFIFHGDNQSASRQAMLTKKNAFKSSGLNIVEFPGSNLELGELSNITQTVTLFGQENAILIEDFFSNRKPGKEKEKIVKYLQQNSSSNILIWEPKNVSLQLKSFPKDVITKFDLPKRLFEYLDTFSLPDLQQTLADTEPQIVLFMLVKHLQSLIAFSNGTISGVPDWKANKLKSQSKKFTLQKLLQMHRQLTNIDYNQKNSLSAMELAMALEVWTIEAVN